MAELQVIIKTASTEDCWESAWFCVYIEIDILLKWKDVSQGMTVSDVNLFFFSPMYPIRRFVPLRKRWRTVGIRMQRLV